jgi:hypothetical protein
MGLTFTQWEELGPRSLEAALRQDPFVEWPLRP